MSTSKKTNESIAKNKLQKHNCTYNKLYLKKNDLPWARYNVINQTYLSFGNLVITLIYHTQFVMN